MPIDETRRRDPDMVLIERMANHLVACRRVKRNATVGDMLQRGWTREEVRRLGDRAVRHAETLMAEQAGQAA
jgi:hypothetical protein